jgi:hypothetical protein
MPRPRVRAILAGAEAGGFASLTEYQAGGGETVQTRHVGFYAEGSTDSGRATCDRRPRGTGRV